MATTNETIARECRLHTTAFLEFILESTHRKWRGYKAAARAELLWRNGTRRLFS
jgi:hypothetical protein